MISKSIPLSPVLRADEGSLRGLRRALPWIVAVLCLLDGMYLKSMIARTPDNDFAKAYFSAVAFVQGGEMYGVNPSTPSGEVDGKVLQLWNLNPPHYHFLLLPLTLLPIYPALLVWCLLNLACFALALSEIQRELRLTEPQRRLALVGVLAFSGTTAWMLSGHCSFLLMLLVTRMWRAGRQGRWTSAGLYLGVGMSIKPFLLILLPYLLLRRRWRAAAAAVGISLACFAAGIAVFGVDNHRAWHDKLGESSTWCWQFINGSLYGLLARTFTANPMGECLLAGPPGLVPLVWLLLGVPAGIATLAATYRETTMADVDRSFALLLTAALLLSPLGWAYYFCLPLGPVAAAALPWWREKTAVSRGSRGLLLFGICALLCPLPLVRLFQPSALATLLLGNLYSYGVLAAWAALLLDGIRALRAPCGQGESAREEPASTFRLEPLALQDQRISVVMPVFSETDSVRLIADWLRHQLGERLLEILIVISPRSSPESRAVCDALTAEDERIRVFEQQHNPGLGRALREGFARVRGNVVLSIDADNEMELTAVPRMLARLAEGNHGLVVGSRWLPGGGFVGYDRKKYLFNWCFQQLFRWLFWTPLHDLTYGFKVLRAELVHGITWEGTLHEIACETTLKVVRCGVSVAEVPSIWTARTQGVSKNTFWRNFRYVRMAAAILRSPASGR